jgi:rhodanese-related sulfurtransferase
MDINVQELHEKRARGDKFVFIDVREPYEFDEFNLGAQLIPLGDLINRTWELDEFKDEEIIIHCRSGKRSAMAQMMLQAQEFTNVRNLEGGVLAWIDAFGTT